MRRWALSAFLVLFSLRALSAQQVSVGAEVSEDEVFVGEPFLLQITVDGTDAVEQPKLEGFDAFRAESLGGQANNSQSISIVNGQMSQTVRRGYVLSFRLTAERTGTFSLPAVRVVAGGRAYYTAPVTVRVSAPTETGDYKLRITASRTRCYVGEPVTVTVTWYLAKDARSLELVSVPLFLDPAFTVVDVDAGANPAGITMPVNRGSVTALKGTERLDGTEFTTFSFRKVILPRKAGTYYPAEATVSFEGSAGTRTVQDFFFGSRQQASYRKLVVPSNRLEFTVLEVPQEGRPADWHGHVGRISLSARAAPVEVRVGDPITFNVDVSGPSVLDEVGFPPLQSFPGFSQRFKIPEEMSDGEVLGRKKTFTQTLRARDEGVAEIPAIVLSYFDTESGSFRKASTEPIPLVVHAAREVTLRDVEGPEGRTDRAEVLSRGEGIAHNYEGAGLLEDREAGFAPVLSSPIWIILLLIPVAVYGAAWTLARLRRAAAADPARGRARRAFPRFRTSLSALRGSRTAPEAAPAALLECLREYLGARLAVSAASLTFEDARRKLDGRLDASVLESLRALFAECEAGRYAGSVPTEAGVAALLDRAERTVADVERSLA